MRFLFLDIDGVLNGHEFDEAAQSCGIKRSCVVQLNRIVASVPRLGVVLSSAWRYMILREAMNINGFQYMLRTHGVSKDLHISGITKPDEAVPTRGLQIRDWLQERNCWPLDKLESFVILDDAPDGMCFEPVRDRLVQTDGKVGLTTVEADRVIAMLLEQD